MLEHGDFTWRVSDCVELVRIILGEMKSREGGR